MTLLLSMPGGSEWILIFIVFGSFIAVPAIAIMYYTKYKHTKSELERVSFERDELMRRLLDINQEKHS